MSIRVNLMMFFGLLFKKYLGSATDPMANPANAISNVMTRLVEGLLMDRSKNRANKKMENFPKNKNEEELLIILLNWFIIILIPCRQ